MENEIKNLSFKDQMIFVGIDVHKKSWSVCIRDESMELRKFSQAPSPEILARHLKSNYPDASYRCVYESGFAGFSTQRELEKLGVSCMVVHAADVPTNAKEKQMKSDQRDCRKLAVTLSGNNLTPIYIPTNQEEEDRSIVRLRDRLVHDQTRCKLRIKSHLAFHGIAIPEKYEASSYWSKEFITWMEGIEFPSGSGKRTLLLLIESYKLAKQQVVKATLEIRTLSKEPRYINNVKLLCGVPGIGPTNAMVFLTELGDIKRFKHLDNLCGYVGLTPKIHGSGDSIYVGKITNRGNASLREALIESSWIAIRKDPALLMCYKEYCKKMPPNKAIIKIARKLLARIRFVLLNQKAYVLGKVQ
jgi:transposase